MAAILSLLIALLPMPESPAPLRVDVEQLGTDRYRLVMIGLDGDERVSQAAIAPVAAQLCKGKEPVFGKFSSTRQVTAGVTEKTPPPRFTQDISCGLSSLPTSRETGLAATPNAVLDASARSAALAFLDAYDAGRGEASWNMFDSGMQAQQPLEKWSAAARDHAATIGSGATRRIVKLSWYTDPPGISPGLYAAADFVGSSSKQALLCGYVAVFRKAEQWKVVRIETGSVPSSVIQSSSPGQLARLKQEIRCVDG